MNTIARIAAALAGKWLAETGRLVALAGSTGEPAGDGDVRKGWENAIRETLGPPLKSLHKPIDDWLGSLPMSVAVACAIGLFVVAGLWVWTLRREFIFRGAPDQKRWRDLRLWAMVVLLPYIAVYILLGR